MSDAKNTVGVAGQSADLRLLDSHPRGNNNLLHEISPNAKVPGDLGATKMPLGFPSRR